MRIFFSAVAVSSVAFMAVALTPLVGPLVDLFIPLPVLYYCSRLGRIKGAAVFILSLSIALAVVGLLGLEVNVAELFAFGFFGLVLSEIFKKDPSIERTVSYSVLTILIIGLLWFFYHLQVTGENPLRMVESYITEGVQESIGVYAQFGISAEQLSGFRQSAPQIVMTIMSLFPALLIVSAISFVLINVLLGRAIFQRAGIPSPEFGNLTFWKIPDQMVWFVIAAGGLVLAPWAEVRLVGLNLLIVFLFIYLFQGFAIISYFFRKRNVPLFLRGIAYFLIFAQNFLFLIVIAVGFADIWLDFRKMNPQAVDSVKE